MHSSESYSVADALTRGGKNRFAIRHPVGVSMCRNPKVGDITEV